MSKKIKDTIFLVIAILFVGGVLAGAALATYIAAWHNQALNLPAPTGSYAVGRAEYDWVDSSRVDALAPQAGVKRELVVWAWYPAAEAGGDPAPYLPPDWVSAREQGEGVLGRLVESEYGNIHTHSTLRAPLAGQGAFPVIIMQPGLGPVATDYTVYAENLASHGYVVFGINQPYSSNLVAFPDGRVVESSPAGSIPDSADAAQADQDANRIGTTWAEDELFVTDRLQDLNADLAGFFHNRLDLAHIGYFGHSFGGATAVRVCAQDAHCQAAADLDGTLFSAESGAVLKQPVLFMAEDDCGSNCDTMHQVYARAQGAAYYLSIANTKHFNYSDLPLRLSPLTRIAFNQVGLIGSIAPERGLEISNAYLVAFFDQVLKGSAAGLLKGASPYPEVRFESH